MKLNQEFLQLKKRFLAKVELRYKPHEFKEIQETFSFGEKAHKGQKRLSGYPYMIHPLEVAFMALDLEENDKEVVMAALLHDVVEDSEITLEKIEQKYGAGVALIVYGMTKDLVMEYNGNITLASSREFFHFAPKILLLKLLDRLNNMKTAYEWPKKTQIKKAEETLNLYVPLANFLGYWEMSKNLRKISKSILIGKKTCEMKKTEKDLNEIVDFWDVCLSFEYDKEKLLRGMTEFLAPFRGKKILDCACGTGFLVLDLIKQGFDITCADGSEDMLKKFRKNAKELGVDVKPVKLQWQELKNHFSQEFDLVICRGNSLVYDSAWEGEKPPSEDSIHEALFNFFSVLKPGGILYLDTTSKENLEREDAEVNNYTPQYLEEEQVKLLEEVQVNKDKKVRKWQPKIKLEEQEYSLVRYSQYLPHEDLFRHLKEVGFGSIQKENIEGEHYDVFTARKN